MIALRRRVGNCRNSVAIYASNYSPIRGDFITPTFVPGVSGALKKGGRESVSRHRNRGGKSRGHWSRRVRKRVDYRCEWPGCEVSGASDTTGAHIYSYRRHVRLRRNVDNGLCLCQPHHRRLDTMPRSVRFQRACELMGEERWRRLQDAYARGPDARVVYGC